MDIPSVFKKRSARRLLGLGALFLAILFIATGASIGRSVKEECDRAQSLYDGQCVDALIEKVSDPSVTRGKNQSIWALGQLGDEKTLPFLRSLDDGQPLPEKESWDEGISQYELRKAVRLIESGRNLTAFIWR